MKYHKEKKLRSDLNLNVGVDILLRLISRLTLILFCLNTVSLSFANDISSSTLPTNAEIVQGSAVIQKQNNRMDINQNSDKVILGWEEFDIGSQAHVNFDQPSEA